MIGDILAGLAALVMLIGIVLEAVAMIPYPVVGGF